VRALVGEGWRVEVDGRVRRSRGNFSIEVATGIDWLDVRVRASFDGADAPLPELLAAIKQRRRTVTLADGSVGELSDASFDKLRRWAAMAVPKGDALRFGKVQAALVAALFEEEAQASFDDAFSKARAELQAFEGVIARPAPRTFRGQLRDYQCHALGWFEALRRFGFGGCLADDMGLGKTVQVLAMLEGRRREKPPPGPSLVVAPRSVLANWASEASRFAPRLRVFVHDGPDRKAPDSHFADYDVVLTTYGLLRQDVLDLSRIDFDYVVLDEAQAIKTAHTASAKAARALRARHRVALTGTPLENHLGELASLLDFLNPGVLGAASSLASLAEGSRRVDVTTRDVLARAVRPFFLRRTKRQVAPELPERVEQTLACELPPEQRRLYDELHAHYKQSVTERVARDGVARSTAHILEALLRLRQAACHPGLIDPSRRGESSAKLDALLEHLETLRTEGQKALVFSQFTSLLSIVRDRLEERGIVFEYLDGATWDRPARVARFQSDESCGVFLLSLKAGGLGLNLTAAEYVFVLDPWWNPAVEAQAIDRAHRIGQTKAIFAYKLLARATVEEKVAQLQAQKRELADSLFGDAGTALAGLTRGDLEHLLA
jgi:SNF2 family DNA or RNA helicase